MFDWIALITPKKATLDTMRTLSCFVSNRRLAPKFQHSLSAVTLGIYVSGACAALPKGERRAFKQEQMPQILGAGYCYDAV
jgi:hypothetical protein